MVEWTEVPGVRLIHGDCLDVMSTLEAGSVDLILSDLPYGTTASKWDVVIPFEPLWACFRRVLKPRGAVVLTACQPFTSMLVMSNPGWFRFDDVWDKVGVTGYLDAKRRPLRRHESILVFAPSGEFAYNPQMGRGQPYSINRSGSAEAYGAHRRTFSASDGSRYPTSIVKISNANGLRRGKVHPTQKPVALFEYLIKTYSNEGETVLDATIGSGTTAVACLNTGRRCVGIERDSGYFDIARRRVQEAAAGTPLLTS